jgi:phage shock protein E
LRRFVTLRPVLLLILASLPGAGTAGPVSAADATGIASAPVVPRVLLLRYLADNSLFTLIDARSAREFDTGQISGAINLPHDSEADIAPLLPANPDAPIVVYCKTGERAALLRSRLLERGYTNIALLQPDQVHWFADMAVFNCGVDAEPGSTGTIFNLLNEGITEEEE